MKTPIFAEIPCFFPANRESRVGDQFAGDCLHSQQVTCSCRFPSSRAKSRKKARSSRAVQPLRIRPVPDLGLSQPVSGAQLPPSLRRPKTGWQCWAAPTKRQRPFCVSSCPPHALVSLARGRGRQAHGTTISKRISRLQEADEGIDPIHLVADHPRPHFPHLPRTLGRSLTSRPMLASPCRSVPGRARLFPRSFIRLRPKQRWCIRSRLLYRLPSSILTPTERSH